MPTLGTESTAKLCHNGGTPSATSTEQDLPQQTVTTYMVVPPDGGWGWVIVAASFVCNLIVDGIVYSFGAFLTDMAASFGESKAKVTLVGSLLSGCYLMAGPFVSALANRYGFRSVTIAGSIIACAGFVASSYATSIEFLILTYGLVGGIGFGLIYVPAVITTGFYFEKWRALATGIAVCGSGIGTCIMAPLAVYLIEKLGWRGALLIQAGIIFNCAICGALFRPLPPVSVTVPVPSSSMLENEKTPQPTPEMGNKVPLLLRIKMAREELKRCDSTVSIDNEVGITAEEPTETTFLGANNNTMYPTAAEVLNRSKPSVNRIMNSNLSLYTCQNMRNSRLNSLTPSENISNRECIVTTPKVKRLHNDDPLDLGMPDDPIYNEHMHDDVFYFRKPTGHRYSAAAAILEASGIRRNSISIRYRSRTMSQSSYRSHRSRCNTMESGVRPLYRDDIFFGGSIRRLPQYVSNSNTLDYTMSVTRLPTWRDVMEEEDSKCRLCPEAVRRTLATMLDLSLLRSPTFLLLCISGFITMMGFFVPFLYLKDRAVVGGMDPSVAVMLISALGATNTLGRVGCGLISSFPGVDSLTINNAALTLGGLATMLSNLSADSTFQFCYAALFGLAISCFASLRSIVIVDLMGMEKLTNAFGLLLLFQGAAATIGSPIAGFFLDVTGSYNASFYLSGSLILLSGVMCYPLKRLNAWEKKRAALKIIHQRHSHSAPNDV